jgi:16S rRNA (adenine1518-N6/adenine1519-N6)-dimethyltransferase
MGLNAGSTAQPSIDRLRRHGIRPDRDLGQNFLVDSNILGVIDRFAALRESDVVLEVGAGLGVLTEHLAGEVAHVHAVEIDRRLEPALAEVLALHPNVTVHWGDALKLDLAALAPAPTALVANLPYGIAATLVIDTIDELRGVDRWTVMVQREVGERLAATAGSAAYGAPSVLAQLACDVRVARAVPRGVFFPVPNVDSVLVTLRRVRPPAEPAVRGLVTGGFAHRRKTLAGSLELGGGPDRASVRAALELIGERPDVRAERLAPARFIDLAQALS